MRIHLVNPSDLSFGFAVITPRWLFVLAAATPERFGDPVLADETLESFDPDTLSPGDVCGISIHTVANTAITSMLSTVLPSNVSQMRLALASRCRVLMRRRRCAPRSCSSSPTGILNERDRLKRWRSNLAKK